jgi:general secretion pathway protein N
MRFAALALVFLLTLSVALVAFAPSSLLDGRLASATQGRLRLAATQGTVWRGDATLTDATGTWAVPLQWRLEPSLLARSFAVVFEPRSNSPVPRGRITLAEATAQVDGLSLAVPAAALEGIVSERGTWAFGGDLTLEAPSFAWNGNRGSGALNLRWRGARVAGGGSVLDLGTVSLDLAPHEDRLRGRLANEGGDIRIAGDVDLSGAGANVDASLTPTPSAPRDIVRALALLGTPDANGAVRVRWRGAPR